MYGNADYQMAMEIAKFIEKWRERDMDPMLNSLAHKLQQQALEEAARQEARTATKGQGPLHRLGNLLVTIGQRMQANRLEPQLADDSGYPNEACV